MARALLLLTGMLVKPRTLGTRIAIAAGGTALVGVGVLASLLIVNQRREALNEAVLSSESIVEAVALSLEHAERTNQREFLNRIVQSVGRHPQIEAIRVFNKAGQIVFSSREDEAGSQVDMRAEACVTCHETAIPLADLDSDERSRVFSDEHGHRVVGTIRVIHNEPGCEGARCHLPVARQSVLGVLDVLLPLDATESRLRSATLKALLISLATVGGLVAGLFLLVRSSIQRPIQQIIQATQRVASGDLDPATAATPSDSSSEIGFLARAFNEMVQNLANNQAQVGEWTQHLEQNLAKRAEELRATQMEVAQAEKLSSVGTVAAGIAHELNSPLMAILTFTHLVQSKVEPGSQEYDDLQMIIHETQRCAGIIRQLLEFSRGQGEKFECEAVDLRDVLERVTKILLVELNNAQVEVTSVFPESPVHVSANRPHLMQVFINLIINAIHAMPDGGSLNIVVEVVEAVDEPEIVPPGSGASSLVRVRLRDSGTGISREMMRRVFDPFFTTKPVGQGSGLGLSVSLGLVQQFGGTILAESDGESWTEFQVILLEAEPNGAIALGTSSMTVESS